MRLHLPSPGEINRSKQLIEQLEKDMDALKGKIANITRTEELEFQKYERDMFLNRQRIEQELIKLRKEYNEVIIFVRICLFPTQISNNTGT